MADSHRPTPPSGREGSPEPAKIIRHDVGGWISGPCLDPAEPVVAEDIETGDLILSFAA
jgi:hypothetical protein